MVELKSEFYVGSRLLEPFCPYVGLPIDQLNYFVCQLVALSFGIFFRKFLCPKTTSIELRHVIEITVGFALGYFCFSYQVLHLLVSSAACYVVMRLVPKQMHVICLVISVGYLLVMHIYRALYDYLGFTLDVTGPLMVNTMRLSSLAFNVHDGIIKDESELKEGQKKYVVKKMPSFLEFFSYVFAFQGIMIGPFCFYKDYIEFVEEADYKYKGEVDNRARSCLSSVFNKLIIAIVSGACMLFVMPMVPHTFFYDPVFESWNFFKRQGYILVCISLLRSRYYFAWTLGEIVNIVSGLGFNGYDDKGKPKWDLVDNNDIVQVELSLSLKENIDAWNKTTAYWLRSLVYERVPFAHTLAVFAMSSIWHGVYPGYYLAFFSTALFVFAGRRVRRVIRPKVLPYPKLKILYDIATFTFTRFANVNMVTSFVSYELLACIRIHTSLYWWLHILSILALLLLPNTKRPQPTVSSAPKESEEKKAE